MIVAHLDTGRDWRGGQAQIALLMRGLAARGVISVLAAPNGPLLERMAAAGFATHTWNPRGDLDLLAMFRAAAWIRRVRPDVVHLHSARAHALGVPAARIAGVSTVVASRRVVIAPRRDPWSRLKYLMPVERWLCVSDAVWDVMRAAGVPREILCVVPSGIDLDTLRADAAAVREAGRDVRAELGIPKDSVLFTTVASLTSEKNHAMLLRVASRMREAYPQVQQVWIGDGRLRAELERARTRLGLDRVIHVLGRRDDVAAWVSPATAVLVASRHEGFCGAAVEAQALGVPVIASAVGGLPEVVRDGETGILVADDDDAAMAAAAAGLIADPARRAAMAVRAAWHAEHFSFERMADRTLAAYRDAAAGRHPAVVG